MRPWKVSGGNCFAVAGLVALAAVLVIDVLVAGFTVPAAGVAGGVPVVLAAVSRPTETELLEGVKPLVVCVGPNPGADNVELQTGALGQLFGQSLTAICASDCSGLGGITLPAVWSAKSYCWRALAWPAHCRSGEAWASASSHSALISCMSETLSAVIGVVLAGQVYCTLLCFVMVSGAGVEPRLIVFYMLVVMLFPPVGPLGGCSCSMAYYTC